MFFCCSSKFDLRATETFIVAIHTVTELVVLPPVSLKVFLFVAIGCCSLMQFTSFTV